jgi:hypothetical protein
MQNNLLSRPRNLASPDVFQHVSIGDVLLAWWAKVRVYTRTCGGGNLGAYRDAHHDAERGACQNAQCRSGLLTSCRPGPVTSRFLVLGGREKLPASAAVVWLASDEVVGQIPVAARMQVSECFSLLDKRRWKT